MYGETLARSVALRAHAPVVDTTALAALPASDRSDGMLCAVGLGSATTFTLWVWVDASVASADATHVLAGDAPATGRWVKLV